MQAPGEDAAGSPPSAARQDRKRSLQRHRGGLKHRKAPSKAPPPPSSAPCPFGCGCWFREKCSFSHCAEDIAVWQQERAAKKALIDIAAARKKARLEGRANRAPLTSLPNNQAPKNTAVAKEKMESDPAPVICAFVQDAFVKDEGASFTTDGNLLHIKSEHITGPGRNGYASIIGCDAKGELGDEPGHHARLLSRVKDGSTVQAAFTDVYFQRCNVAQQLSQTELGTRLQKSDTRHTPWKIKKHSDGSATLIPTQDNPLKVLIASCNIDPDILVYNVHIDWPGE